VPLPDHQPAPRADRPPRPDAVSTYRLAPHVVARLVGALLAAVGLLLVVLTLVAAVLRLPPAALLGCAAVGLAAVGAVAAYTWRGLTLVRLDGTGYRARVRRDVGARSARWTDVKDAVTAEVSGVPCVVIRLRDGRTTTIPVDLLAVDRDAFVTDVRARLLTRGAR
jgi:hypothetical protein